MWGKCTRDKGISPAKENFDPFVPCLNSSTCLNIDKNLICNNHSSGKDWMVGPCACRKDMKWNTKLMECQARTS